MQAWLARFAALLVKELGPWVWGLLAGLVTKLITYVKDRIQKAKEKKEREEATKKLDESIKNNAPREERQKDEQDMLNS